MSPARPPRGSDAGWTCAKPPRSKEKMQRARCGGSAAPLPPAWCSSPCRLERTMLAPKMRAARSAQPPTCAADAPAGAVPIALNVSCKKAFLSLPSNSASTGERRRLAQNLCCWRCAALAAASATAHSKSRRCVETESPMRCRYAASGAVAPGGPLEGLHGDRPQSASKRSHSSKKIDEYGSNWTSKRGERGA